MTAPLYTAYCCPRSWSCIAFTSVINSRATTEKNTVSCCRNMLFYHRIQLPY